jgi:hypothetical protein
MAESSPSLDENKFGRYNEMIQAYQRDTVLDLGQLRECSYLGKRTLTDLRGSVSKAIGNMRAWDLLPNCESLGPIVPRKCLPRALPEEIAREDRGSQSRLTVGEESGAALENSASTPFQYTSTAEGGPGARSYSSYRSRIGRGDRVIVDRKVARARRSPDDYRWKYDDDDSAEEDNAITRSDEHRSFAHRTLRANLLAEGRQQAAVGASREGVQIVQRRGSVDGAALEQIATEPAMLKSAATTDRRASGHHEDPDILTDSLTGSSPTQSRQYGRNGVLRAHPPPPALISQHGWNRLADGRGQSTAATVAGADIQSGPSAMSVAERASMERAKAERSRGQLILRRQQEQQHLAHQQHLLWQRGNVDRNTYPLLPEDERARNRDREKNTFARYPMSPKNYRESGEEE